MFSNTTGNNNVAAGYQALNLNTTGRFNVASGSKAMLRNRNGLNNTALGYLAMDSNTGGDSNVAVGTGAGGDLTTGDNNVAIANPGVAGESGEIRIGTRDAKRGLRPGISGHHDKRADSGGRRQLRRPAGTASAAKAGAVRAAESGGSRRGRAPAAPRSTRLTREGGLDCTAVLHASTPRKDKPG